MIDSKMVDESILCGIDRMAEIEVNKEGFASNDDEMKYKDYTNPELYNNILQEIQINLGWHIPYHTMHPDDLQIYSNRIDKIANTTIDAIQMSKRYPGINPLIDNNHETLLEKYNLLQKLLSSIRKHRLKSAKKQNSSKKQFIIFEGGRRRHRMKTGRRI